MPYFVKWTRHGDDAVISNNVSYPDPVEALDFACGALGQKPNDIWVEDESGTRVADEIKIIRHCMKQTKYPGPAKSGQPAS